MVWAVLVPSMFGYCSAAQAQRVAGGAVGPRARQSMVHRFSMRSIGKNAAASDASATIAAPDA
jgi:hypothetical protein